MAGENARNYHEQGGDRWVVGGEIDIAGKLLLGGAELKRAANQADSTAADVAGLVTDFNNLLAKLKAAGLMEPDS